MSFRLSAPPAPVQRFAAYLVATVVVVLLLTTTVSAQNAILPIPSTVGEARLDAPRAPRASGRQTNDSVASLEALIAAALRDNPEIRASVARLNAAAERPAQASSLEDPVLMGSFTNVGFGSFTLGDEMMSAAGIRFTQALPYRGKRGLRAATARRGIDVAAARRDVIARRVAREVAEAYFELAFVHEAVDIVADTRDYLVNLERTAEARYAVGEGIQQDVLKAQVEVSVLLNRLIMLDQQRDSTETELNRLLGRPVTAPIDPPAELAPPFWDFVLADLQAEALASSTQLREGERQIDEQRASLDVARSETKPDWMLSGAWMNRGSLPDVWEVNVGITLPLYKGTKQERAIAEAAEAVRASEHDLQDSSNMVAATVREQYLRAERAARLLQLYGEAIIPQATLSLESAAAGYEVGRVDFLAVLDNIVTLLTYQLEYYRQSSDYMQALARIEEHVGRSLGATPTAAFAPSVVPTQDNETISGGNR